MLLTPSSEELYYTPSLFEQEGLSEADLHDSRIAAEFLVEQMRAAAPLLHEYYKAGIPARRTSKEDNTPVTPVDEAIGELFISAAELWSNGRIGTNNEERAVNIQLEIVQDVDPLDGTHEGSALMPSTSIIVAYRVGEKVISSATYSPLSDEFGGGLYVASADGACRYTAERDSSGTIQFVNPRELKIVDPPLQESQEPQKPLILVDPKIRKNMPGLFELMESEQIDVRDLAPTGDKFTRIAENAIAATIRDEGADDVRGGLHLVEAAGGKVCSLNGDPQIFTRDPESGVMDMNDGYIAGNPQTVEHLLRIVELYRSDESISEAVAKSAAAFAHLRTVLGQRALAS